MNLDRLKEDAGQTWRWVAEGWRHISDKAMSALTYFSPGQEDEGGRDMRWGVLAVDVSDHGESVIVELEAPGLNKADIDVTVADRRLVVTGSKRCEAQRKEGAMRITERAFGQFQRVILLPDVVLAEGATATYKRGVLTVKVLKAKPPSVRKIKILSG